MIYTSYTISDKTISLYDTITTDEGDLVINNIFRFKNDMMIVYTNVTIVSDLIIEKMDKFFEEKTKYFDTIKHVEPNTDNGDCGCCGKTE